MVEAIIGLIQLNARLDKAESLKAVRRLATRIPDNSIIAIPEYAMYDPTGVKAEELNRVAETLEGSWVKGLSEIARSKGSCVIGTLIERNSNGKPYNTAVILDERGEVIASYRKTHLFDALGYRESDVFTPGERLFTPVKACGLRIGLAICFEIRFPEILRYQALKGADLVVIPSAWYTGHGKEEQYRFLAQARAHENTIWIAAPILYGSRFTGRSMVVDPLGVVTAEAGYGEKVLQARVDTREVERAREILPLLGLRRTDLYSGVG